MKMRVFFFIIFWGLSASSFCQECSIWCNKRTKYNFKLLKREELRVDTGLVKVSGVYMISYELNQEKKYSFIRFFDNGRVYFSCEYCSFPNEEELNNLNYGNYGHYTIKNGEIKAETFEPYPRYYFIFYSIGKDHTITTNGSCKRRWPEAELRNYVNIKTTYTFYKGNLTSRSFW